MKIFNFKKIDAFATTNSAGNPAGYVKLNSQDEINEIEMQKIAKELKGFVNEVGFLFRDEKNIFNLKFYSSEKEVAFCGHATIAIMYDLIKNDVNLIDKNRLIIKTNRGVLSVENRLREEDAVFIMSPIPFKKDLSLKLQDITNNLKIEMEDIDNDYSISIINARLTTLLVPIKNLDSILKINPDFESLKHFCFSKEIDIIETFTKDVSDKSNDFRTRVFAPTFGYLEDPATGSGNSAFGYYLLNFGHFKKNTIMIEQNNDRNRFNIVKLQKKIDDEKNERILFGGNAINRIEGNYYLY